MKRVGLVIFALFAAHVAFNLLFLGIFGEPPCVPGDVVELQAMTSEYVFLHRFSAFGEGTFESSGARRAEQSYLALPWSVVAQPSTMWGEEIYKTQSDPVMERGVISVNVHIPRIAVSKRTVVEGYITIGGYVARPVDWGYFENIFVTQMTSEPAKLVLYPPSMTWLVRQSYWYNPFSFFAAIFGLWLAGRLRIPVNPSTRSG